TSRRLNLRSEASSRFEKGIAIEFVDEAVDRACYLLQQYANGTVLQDRVDEGDLGQFVTPIEITVEEVNKTIGYELSKEDIEAIVGQLGVETKREGNTQTMMVPSRRKDITLKEDLIEEIARIYGYDDRPTTLPVFEHVTPRTLNDRHATTRIVKATLQAAGLS